LFIIETYYYCCCEKEKILVTPHIP